STAPITARSGICTANSTKSIPEPGMTTTGGAATGTGTDTGTRISMGMGTGTATGTATTTGTATDQVRLMIGEDWKFLPQNKESHAREKEHVQDNLDGHHGAIRDVSDRDIGLCSSNAQMGKSSG